MKRTRKPKPTAILTADIELRKDAPLCRTDKDYFQTLSNKIAWLRELQRKYDCPVFDGGDLFDKKYKTHPSHNLLNFAIENLPRPFYTVPGNHDLPGKSMANYHNSAMAVLERAETVIFEALNAVVTWADRYEKPVYVDPYPWGVDIEQLYKHYEKWMTIVPSYRVALVHTMVYDKHPPFPGCEGYEKKELIKLLKDYDLIVCGHNHQTFTGKIGNTLLVNPGSLMRNDADQTEHKPCVFLWYAELGKAEPVYVPVEKGVVSREHIDQKAEIENRLDAFTEKLGEQAVKGINFEQNLENALNKNKINKYIIDKVWKYYEST